MLTLDSIVRRVRPTQLLLAAALALSACQETAQPVPGPVVCEVAGSSNLCFRCQAQRCGAALDRCQGAGFHEGRAVQSEPAGCMYDSDFNGRSQCPHGIPDASPRSAAPCAWLAVCLQSCGCGQDCARMCTTYPDGGREITGAFANDPREAVCNACLAETLAPCVRQNCAAECPPT
jgi:hypothetical protein